MEEDNKELPIQGSYFPCLYEERNNIALEISSNHVPLLIHCEIAQALEFMGFRIHLIIDKLNNVLYVLPNHDNAQWQQLAKQSPLWMATYGDEAVELRFNGSQSKHQQIKDKLLTIIQEIAITAIPVDYVGIKIKGSFSYELGGFCFPLNSNNVEFVRSANYKEFMKYASDSDYYRIKINALPYCRTPFDGFSFKDKINAIRKVLKDRFNCKTVYGQLRPEEDWEQYKDDDGHYLFINSNSDEGKIIEQKLTEYYEALTKREGRISER